MRRSLARQRCILLPLAAIRQRAGRSFLPSSCGFPSRRTGLSLALLALALERARWEHSRNLLVLLALGGAALFYGDSMITPAISVLSAVEGIGIATPALNRFVLPLTIIVLLALFLFQKGAPDASAAFSAL